MIARNGNFDMVRITRSVQRIRSNVDLKITPIPRLQAPIGSKSTAWSILRRDLRFGTTLAQYLEPRDRVTNVKMRKCGNRRRIFMKTGTTLATALFALASLPLLAQQPPPANQPNSPATQPSTPPATPQNPPSAQPAASSAASPETAAAPATAEMSPVNGELVSKLDSKTAKSGDNVVVKTETSIKTADGTEIPKGSKLIGHIIAVQPSGAGTNSQVALQFDHVELKGGQSVAVHSQIQSISPPGGAASPGGSAAMSGGAASAPPASGSSNRSMNGSAAGSTAGAPQPSNSDSAAAPAAGNAAPAAGTVVAKNGNIAISTTSIPGVLLANNAPGQQDPRMAQASSILLGAKKDIQLDGGTQMVVGLSAAGGGTR